MTKILSFKNVAGLMMVLALSLAPLAHAQDRNADHDALRALLQNALTALNTGNVDALAPYLAPNFVITTVGQRQYTDLATFKQYWDDISNGKISNVESFKIDATAAQLSNFLDDNVAVSYGTGSVTVKWPGYDPVTMNGSWTATVQRVGGQWKVAALHTGTDFLNNPVLDWVKEKVFKYGIAGVVIGLIIGLIIGMLLGRRRATGA